MAEHSFQEVMRQYKRLLRAHNNGEPIPVEVHYPCMMQNTELFEEKVMAWDAEHPEPVYPTWGEWFVKQSGLAKEWKNAANPAWEANMAIGMFRMPIPADIAEKLGIEPKEK